MDAVERFYSHTKREGDCLVWTGARVEDGYGAFGVDGKRVRAHRWIYQQVNGPLPPHIKVRHTCDNPPCVDLCHLLEGTQRDNLLDAVERGRNKNTAKTHCPANHPYDEENTYMYKNRRCCRKCNAAAAARYKARKVPS